MHCAGCGGVLAKLLQVPFQKGLSASFRMHCVERFRAELSTASFRAHFARVKRFVADTVGPAVVADFQAGPNLESRLSRALRQVTDPGVTELLAVVAFFAFGHAPVRHLYEERFPDFLIYPKDQSAWKHRVRMFVLVPLADLPQASVLEWAHQLFLQYSFPFHKLSTCAPQPRERLLHTETFTCRSESDSETIMMFATTKHHSLSCFRQMPYLRGVPTLPTLPPAHHSVFQVSCCVLDVSPEPDDPTWSQIRVELRVLYRLPVPQKFIGLRHALSKRLLTQHLLERCYERAIDFSGALREWESGLKSVRRRVILCDTQDSCRVAISTNTSRGKTWAGKHAVEFPCLRPHGPRPRPDPWAIMSRRVPTHITSVALRGVNTRLEPHQSLSLQWLSQRERVPMWRWLGVLLGDDHQVLVSPFLHRHSTAGMQPVPTHDVFGGVLASDAGTGKTLVMLALAVDGYLRDGHKTIVFVPKNQLTHWREEICRHVHRKHWAAVRLNEYRRLHTWESEWIATEFRRVVFDSPRLLQENTAFFRQLCDLPVQKRWVVQSGRTTLRRLLRLLQLDHTMPHLDLARFQQNGPEGFIVARQLCLRLTSAACLQVPKQRCHTHFLEHPEWYLLLRNLVRTVHGFVRVKGFNWNLYNTSLWKQRLCVPDDDVLKCLPHKTPSNPWQTFLPLSYDDVARLGGEPTPEAQRCAICLEPRLKEPVFPPCFHGLCFGCARRLVGHHDASVSMLKCPVCQQVVSCWFRPGLSRQDTWRATRERLKGTAITRRVSELVAQGAKVLVCGAGTYIPRDANVVPSFQDDPAALVNRWAESSAPGALWWGRTFPEGVRFGHITDIALAELEIDTRCRAKAVHHQLGGPELRVHYFPFRGSLAHFLLQAKTNSWDRKRMRLNHYKRWLTFASTVLESRNHGTRRPPTCQKSLD